jgi:hypothetical protein
MKRESLPAPVFASPDIVMAAARDSPLGMSLCSSTARACKRELKHTAHYRMSYLVARGPLFFRLVRSDIISSNPACAREPIVHGRLSEPARSVVMLITGARIAAG